MEKTIEEKKKEIIETCKNKDIKFIRLQFTDILGILKSFAIPFEELENALDDGMGFDGSSITGYVHIEESDMVALPDPDTFAILPWRPKEKGVARLICDVLEPGGKNFEGCPRYVLKRNLKELEKEGYIYNLGPELEYFYFKSSQEPEVLDRGGYFDLIPLDLATDLRRETIFALEEMGIRVEYSHHEVAPSQHEIDLRFTDALRMADYTQSYKLAVKAIAQIHGVYATFMPKPIFGENASGMHTHQSLFKGNKNAFFDPDDEYKLSDIGKRFIAGQLVHAREICAVLAQWVNSYKRLVPGYEAPVYISWARRNRSALIRVPMYKPGKELAMRAELRSPDPACNPYLAFSVMLAAGMEGIKKKYELPEPIERDIYALSEEEKKELGIESLPSSLKEAIEEMENSELVRKALGDHVYENFLDLKKKEWEEYSIQVHPYEIKKYLHLL
ncbi:MAG: glutamine synthetase family protein [Candidatus Hydrothermarchaeota archaeon]